MYKVLLVFALLIVSACNDRDVTTVYHAGPQTNTNSSYQLEIRVLPLVSTNQPGQLDMALLNLRLINNSHSDIMINSIRVRLLASDQFNSSGAARFKEAGLKIDPMIMIDPDMLGYNFIFGQSISVSSLSAVSLEFLADLLNCSTGDAVQIEVLEVNTSIGIFDPQALPADVYIDRVGQANLCG